MRKTFLFITSIFLFAVFGVFQNAQAQTTAFSYQGVLNNGGSTAGGNYNFEFYLRDAPAGGNAVGATNTLPMVAVTKGLFTVSLDFGSNVFTGTNYWLEIGVRTSGSTDSYVILSPRQALGAVPYALYAMTPAGTNGLNGTNGATGPAGPLLADLALVDTNQTFTASNIFAGVVIATNTSNTIVGTFTGNLVGAASSAANAAFATNSIFAANAGTTASVSGSVAASQITGTLGTGQLGNAILANNGTGTGTTLSDATISNSSIRLNIGFGNSETEFSIKPTNVVIDTGTFSAVAGSHTWTGSAGAFTGWTIGQQFVPPDNKQYNVVAVNSSTSITTHEAAISTYNNVAIHVNSPVGAMYFDNGGNGPFGVTMRWGLDD